MAKEYRQNASYNEIISGDYGETPEAEGNEGADTPQESKGNGNTRLPFGLCKRYGIALPEGATPRDAWNALKGKGITPEKVYKELSEKEEKQKEETKAEDQKQSEIKKAEYVNNIINSKAYNSLTKTGKEKVKNNLDKLTEDNLKVVNKYIGELSYFINGAGYFKPVAMAVSYNQNSTGEPLDNELGFDFEATTFFHEYGHFIDNNEAANKKGKRFGYMSTDVQYKEDLSHCLNQIIQEGGYDGQIKNLERMTRGEKDAILKGLAKITGKGTEKQYKSAKDFGYVSQPQKPFFTIEQAVKWAPEWSKEERRKEYEGLWADYNQQLIKYKEAEASGANQAALEKSKEWNSEIKAANKGYYVNLNRYTVVTDFITMATNGRIDCHNNGFRAHSAGYAKAMAPQVEAWAEYFASKMTNDTKALGIMKKYLPNLYNGFEVKFNEIKGD